MTKPKEILETIITIPFQIDKDEYKFWRLRYALKWQQQKYNSISFDFLWGKAKQAFAKLGCQDPNAEAGVLEMVLDGAATVILLKTEMYDQNKLLKSI